MSIAQLLNVSRSTLYRRCKEMGLGSDADDNRITYNDLLPVVIDIKKDFPDFGERLLLGIQHSRGISCSRETLRQVVHDVDPIKTALRWNAKLCRRTYSVPGPNSLWHIGKFQVAI